MSKIEAGRLELEMLPFRPADLAEPGENLSGLKAQEQGLEFEVLTGSGVQRHRLGDQNRVRQILNNLIGNAINFTETGEVIVKISARSRADLTIEVRDSGIGISPEQQKHADAKTLPHRRTVESHRRHPAPGHVRQVSPVVPVHPEGG
ncbi:MAG: hypothetical protein KDG55_24740, partial [Rhodocyclaceae bacterium]|nr:hypothetical protein [Rhodocyclaceae bacterium]